MSDQELMSQWIEISASALLSNIRLFRELLKPGIRLTAVVKANAYGHGLEETVRSTAAAVDCFAVHSLAEACLVRRFQSSRPVLIMGYLTSGECTMLEEGMEVLVSSREVLSALSKRGEIPIHLKIDSGTHRQGLALSEIGEFVTLARNFGLPIVGIATHFANIEDTLQHDFARYQLGVFEKALEKVRELGLDPPWIHAACSAAALLFEETRFTMARIGISLYGHWPSRETQLSWILEHGRETIPLQSALMWKTRVGQLQNVEAGETVGYGRSWRASRKSRLAVLPTGYSDGYPRALGNRGRVLVGDRFAPVVGRICMNIMMVDVTDIPGVVVGDEVVLIGRMDDNMISAEEIAELAGSINYEVLSRIGSHIPRIVV